MALPTHVALVAGAVSTIDLDHDAGSVAVFHAGNVGTEVFVTVGSTSASPPDPKVRADVGGPVGFLLPAGARRVLEVETDGPVRVKAKSSGAALLEVELG